MINKIFTIILTILFLIPSPFAQGETSAYALYIYAGHRAMLLK